MTALGATECLGGIFSGKMIDHCGKKFSIVVQLITGMIGYGCILVAVRT